MSALSQQQRTGSQSQTRDTTDHPKDQMTHSGQDMKSSQGQQMQPYRHQANDITLGAGDWGLFGHRGNSLWDWADNMLTSPSWGLPSAWDDLDRLTEFPARMMTRLPTMDMNETDKAIELSVDFPGVRPEDVKVDIKGNQLTISGQRQNENHEERPDYRYYSKSSGTFSRSLTLPKNVDASHIKSDYQNGLLKVTLPKTGNLLESGQQKNQQGGKKQ